MDSLINCRAICRCLLVTLWVFFKTLFRIVFGIFFEDWPLLGRVAISNFRKFLDNVSFCG